MENSKTMWYTVRQGGSHVSILIAVPLSYAVNEEELSVRRREKAARFSKEEDRKRCLCAGVALDLALQTVGLREKTATIAVNENGKPYLSERPEWHFSLSHSGNWAVCALSDAPIGVDVEQYRDKEFLSLADRFFTREEYERLRQCPKSERETLFFRLWTEKESLLKAAGTGLSGLSQCETLIGDYAFRSYPLDGYALAVCTTGEFPQRITFCLR